MTCIDNRLFLTPILSSSEKNTKAFFFENKEQEEEMKL